MAFSVAWQESNPVGTQEVNVLDDYQRELRAQLGERLESMLYGFNTSSNSGAEGEYGVKHLKFYPQTSDPTADTDYGFLYVKTIGGREELFYEDDAGNVKQITSAGTLKVVAGDYAADSIDEDDIRLSNNAYLTGRNAAGTGDINIIKVNASDEIELGAVTQLPDTSKLATSAAPTADAQIANKKYVDDTAHTGGVVQTVHTVKTAVQRCTTIIPFDDTIPQNTEGDEVMTCSITPTSATNKLLIRVIVQVSNDSFNTRVAAALFQDTTANALAVGYGCERNYRGFNSIVVEHYMDAGTTNATTFKVRVGANSGNATVNGDNGSQLFGGACSSTITITELKV